jgi:glucose/arabinose dehydrogenase
MMEEQAKNAIQQAKNQTKRWPILLVIVPVMFVIAGGLLYDFRHQIREWLTNSHEVGGKAGVARLHLPPGFQMNVFSTGLHAPRFITFSPDGTLFVAERGSGSLVALPDAGHLGKTSEKKVIVSGLNDPTSLVFYQDALYVGERTHISRFTRGPNFEVTSRKVVIPNLPAGGNHITRTVLIGPDGKIYVSIGSSCNVCLETDPHRAAVWIYNLDGSGGRLYARGLRNAVGMTINPWNSQIWVTNNGRDYMGDNLPPDTVYALQDGGNSGWPRCHAGDLLDPNYGHPGDCKGVVAPLINLQAHSAPLGLAFYKAGRFPSQYHGLFIAFHGSWNRSLPTGYKVVFVPLSTHGQVAGPVQDFATGWLMNTNNARGRPVGLAIGPDGALYVSDDKGGVIYRITSNA